ncbi:flotillin family protein [[Eubacterium] cellulosolvens]
MWDSTVILGMVVMTVVIIFMALVLIYAARYKRVPPDKAMVVYGKKVEKVGAKGYKVLTGGGKFIWPIVEAVEFLPLDVRTLVLSVTDIVTDVKTSGAKVNIKAVAQIKIASDPTSLATAAEQLLHKSDPAINEIAQKTLEGHVRGICATMTIEAINSDRDAVATNVQTQAAKDLRNMGIEIRSFVISDLEDERGYLDALGRRRTAEVIRDARIGEAMANREATIREAEAARDGEKANAEAEAQVAIYHKDRDIIRQRAEAEVQVEKANRDISFELQDKKRRQELIKEQIQIEIEERQKRIDLQEREIDRKRKEQEAQHVVPAQALADAKVAEADGDKIKIQKLAEAKRDQLRITAEGERDQLKMVAEGESEKLKLIAEGEAERIRREGVAEADVIQLKGEAEAAAIKAKGLAEAEAMEKKADAWKMYGEAAVTQMIVEQLPEIVKSASLPLQGVEKVIVLGDQGPGGLVQKTVSIAAEMPALVKSLTGMDVTELVGKVGGAVGGKTEKK